MVRTAGAARKAKPIPVPRAKRKADLDAVDPAPAGSKDGDDVRAYRGVEPISPEVGDPRAVPGEAPGELGGELAGAPVDLGSDGDEPAEIRQPSSEHGVFAELLPPRVGDESWGSVDLQPFAAAVAVAASAVDGKQTVPVLGGLLLEFGGGSVAITGTDLDIVLRVSLASFGITASCVVSAKVLKAALSGLDGVKLKVKVERGALHLAGAGGGVRRLPTMAAEDFPELAIGEAAASVTIARKDWQAAASRVAAAVSTEETRFYLNGVFVEPSEAVEDGGLRLVATDGHRLHWESIDAEGDAADWPPMIIPTAAIKVIEAALKHAEHDTFELAAMECGSRIVLRIDENVTLITKLVDGTFPEYRRVIPGHASLKHVLTCPANVIASAASRCAAIAAAKTRAVRFDFSRLACSAAVIDPEAGAAREPIPGGEFAGDDLTAGFNAAYLGAALGAFGSGRVHFRLQDSVGPALIEGEADDKGNCPRFRAVLMPHRV